MLKLISLLAVFAVALGAPSGPLSYSYPVSTNKSLGIIGGTPADISQFPWTVSVQFSGDHVCGGSLISDTWVLTSGRCIEVFEDVSIRAGSSQFGSGGVTVQGDKYVIHPDYNPSTLDNNVALVRLVAPVNHANASVIQLPAENQAVQAGAQLILTGWGSTSEENGFPSDNLLQTTVPVVSAQQCSQAYAGIATITNTMLCAGLLGQGGKGPCIGDTGVPAIVNNQLIGVVSFTSGCARPNYPAVFANVAVIRAWIREITGV